MDKAASAGKPVEGVKVKVEDPETGEELLKEKSAKSLFTRHSYLKAMRTTLKRQQKCRKTAGSKPEIQAM